MSSFPKALAKVGCFFELAKHSEEKISKNMHFKWKSLFLCKYIVNLSDVTKDNRHSSAYVEV